MASIGDLGDRERGYADAEAERIRARNERVIAEAIAKSQAIIKEGRRRRDPEKVRIQRQKARAKKLKRDHENAMQFTLDATKKLMDELMAIHGKPPVRIRKPATSMNKGSTVSQAGLVAPTYAGLPTEVGMSMSESPTKVAEAEELLKEITRLKDALSAYLNEKAVHSQHQCDEGNKGDGWTAHYTSVLSTTNSFKSFIRKLKVTPTPAAVTTEPRAVAHQDALTAESRSNHTYNIGPSLDTSTGSNPGGGGPVLGGGRIRRVANGSMGGGLQHAGSRSEMLTPAEIGGGIVLVGSGGITASGGGRGLLLGGRVLQQSVGSEGWCGGVGGGHATPGSTSGMHILDGRAADDIGV